MSDYVVCNEQEAIMNTYMPMNTNSLMYMFPSCTYIHMLPMHIVVRPFHVPLSMFITWPICVTLGSKSIAFPFQKMNNA